MNEQDLVQEFLLESTENLGRLDQEMVQLERDPDNSELLASVFRTIHTIKGTCGFLDFNRLETLAHVTEDILSDLRNGKWPLDSNLTTVILESVDAIKRILGAIESGAGEGPIFEAGLISRLERARDREDEVHIAQEQPDAAGGGLPNATSPSRIASSTENTLRVDVGLLDRLMNLVGELVLTRNQLVQCNALRDDAPLNAVSQRLNLITSELQESVKTRMQPIGVVWNKLPRVVRDLAASLNKRIELQMDGADTELDRTIIDAIKDPLTHSAIAGCFPNEVSFGFQLPPWPAICSRRVHPVDGPQWPLPIS